MGYGAQRLVDTNFRGLVTAQELLTKNSVFGFLNLRYEPSEAARWAGLHAERASLGRTHGALRLGHKQGLAWCPECLEADLNRRGYGDWRVLHQLPFMSLCPVHRRPLLVSCRRCGLALDSGKGFRLPGDSCSSCGSTEFSTVGGPNSDMYFSVLREVRRIFISQSDDYRPSGWEKYCQSEFGSKGVSEAQSRAIMKDLRRKFPRTGFPFIRESTVSKIDSSRIFRLLRGGSEFDLLLLGVAIRMVISGA